IEIEWCTDQRRVSREGHGKAEVVSLPRVVCGELRGRGPRGSRSSEHVGGSAVEIRGFAARLGPRRADQRDLTGESHGEAKLILCSGVRCHQSCLGGPAAAAATKDLHRTSIASGTRDVIVVPPGQDQVSGNADGVTKAVAGARSGYAERLLQIPGG